MSCTGLINHHAFPSPISIESTTLTWSQSPKAIVAARDETQRAVSQLLQDPKCKTDPNVEFNQVLSCCYVGHAGMKVSLEVELEAFGALYNVTESFFLDLTTEVPL